MTKILNSVRNQSILYSNPIGFLYMYVLCLTYVDICITVVLVPSLHMTWATYSILHLGHLRVSGEEQLRLQGDGPARLDVLLRRHRRVQARFCGVREPLQGRHVVPRPQAHGIRRAQHQIRARLVLRGDDEHWALGGHPHHGMYDRTSIFKYN